MSDIGDRMADSDPQRARTKAEADHLQKENERRVQKMLEEPEEDPPSKS